MANENIKVVTDKKKAAVLKKKMDLYKKSLEQVSKDAPFEKIFKILVGATKDRNHIIEHVIKNLDPRKYKNIIDIIRKAQTLDRMLETEISKFNKDYQQSIIELGKLETELAKEVEAKEVK